MKSPIVFLNGEFTTLDQAKVSVLDRGFIFGDGIYEVIPLYAGELFLPDQHLARLFRNLEQLKINNPFEKDTWLRVIRQVVEGLESQDQLVYIQVTRGVAPRAHAFPIHIKPTIFIMSNPFRAPDASQRLNGVRCVSAEDRRWHRCDIKSISLLGNVMAAQYAAEHDATETIMFRDDYLTEGSASNVWMIKDGTMYAPPNDNLILEGIRYQLIEAMCQRKQIPLVKKRIHRSEILSADEVMLSSATKEILPVRTIDEAVIGTGQPGPIFQCLYKAYREAISASSKFGES